MEFIAGLHPNTWIILSLPLLIYLLATLLLNFFKAIGILKDARSTQFKNAIARLVLALIFIVLFFPAGRLGNYVKTQIFLKNLPRYEELSKILITEKRAFVPQAGIPKEYSDLCYNASWDQMPDGTTAVLFLTDDYGLPARHQGYVYISSDDPSSLNQKIGYSSMGFARIAPRWYEWAD
jgi:hypothetical protein